MSKKSDETAVGRPWDMPEVRKSWMSGCIMLYSAVDYVLEGSCRFCRYITPIRQKSRGFLLA